MSENDQGLDWYSYLEKEIYGMLTRHTRCPQYTSVHAEVWRCLRQYQRRSYAKSRSVPVREQRPDASGVSLERTVVGESISIFRMC
jgi:hypothetical protein